MPFLTEELWQQLPQRQGARSIALERFPKPHAERIDASSEEQVALLQEIITAVRNIRAEMKVDQNAKLAAQLAPATPEVKSTVEGSLETILSLAGLSSLSFAALPFDSTKGVVRSSKYFELFIGYEAAFDVSAEIARLRKESKQLETNIASNQKRLEDQTFRSRAPGHIVKGLETTLAERRTEFEKLTQRLAQLEKNLGASGQPET